MRKNDNHAKIKEMYESGRTFEQIAEEMGYKITSIRVILNNLGISFAKDKTVMDKVCRQMRKDGKSLIEISKATGRSKPAISTYLSRCKLSTRRSIDRGTSYNLEKDENLVYAEQPKEIPYTGTNGKKYREINEMLYPIIDIQTI